MEKRENLFTKLTAKVCEIQSYGVKPNIVRMSIQTRDAMLADAPMDIQAVMVGDRTYDCLLGLPTMRDNKVRFGEFVFAKDFTIAHDLTLASRLFERMNEELLRVDAMERGEALKWFGKFANMVDEETK